MKISLTMIVRNEEPNLESCLRAACPLVDEMVIVDTGSTDDTVEIAKSLGAKVFNFKWNDDFSAARNFAIGKSTGDWNLILDADEIITNISKEEMIEYAKLNTNRIGRLTIRSKFNDNGDAKYSNSKISRFAPRGVGFEGRIHEQLDLSYQRFDTKIIVEHSGYFQKNKSDRNLELLLMALEDEPEDSYYIYQTARALFGAKRYMQADLYFKKGMKFLSLDMPYTKDFIVSYMYNCIYGNMVEKILDFESIGKEYFADSVDFNFVYGIFCMEIAKYNPNKYINYLVEIEKSYLRCLEIGESDDSLVEGTGSYLAAYNLGVFYEITGNKEFAIKYYEESSTYEYELAKNRLTALKK